MSDIKDSIKNLVPAIGRDQVGEKSLHFRAKNRRFCFGFELKILHAVDWGAIDVSPVSVSHFLDKLYVPSPSEIVEGMQKLRQRSWLRVDRASAETAAFSPRNYWSTVETPRKTTLLSLSTPYTQMVLTRFSVRLSADRCCRMSRLGRFCSAG